MHKSKMLHRLRQLPVICAWRTGIFFASKSLYRNIVVCDVTSTQSKHRDRFATDVKSVLEDLALTSPEQLQRIQRHIRYIARAEIDNRFEYFASSRLLLLHVDYDRRDVDTRNSIKGDIVEAATSAQVQSERESDWPWHAQV